MKRLTLALAITVACSQPQSRVATPAPDSSIVAAVLTPPCEPLPAGDIRPDTIRVGLTGVVDIGHAPAPTTEAERLAFNTFYESLIRIDCEGRAHPGLAEEWSVDGEGRRWQFKLREGAHFWDGTPVTARDVVVGWSGRPEVLGYQFSTPNERTLSVVLSRPDTSALRFADPALAVAKLPLGEGAPIGTSPYRVVSWLTEGITGAPTAGGGPAVRFHFARVDPRELLDQGIDILVTDDPRVLEYAHRRDSLAVAPLPWAWTYVFLGTPPVSDAELPRLAAELAGAVRGDVRPAEAPFWWINAPACGAVRQEEGRGFPAGDRRIVYPAGDRVARDIAGRLVALAASGRAFDGGRVVSVGLASDAFDVAVARQNEFGYIMALPRRPYAHCLDLPAIVTVPLLDARAAAVARRGRVGIDVDWDGAPRLKLSR